MNTVTFNLIDQSEDDWTCDTDILCQFIDDAMFDLGFEREDGKRASYRHRSNHLGHYEAAVEQALDAAAEHDGASIIASHTIDFYESPCLLFNGRPDPALFGPLVAD
ncbi:hypothetical protein ACUXST_001388 [Sphingomonas sp. F9_3S_D5_B_2]